MVLGCGQMARGGKVGPLRISWVWAALGLAGLDWTGPGGRGGSAGEFVDLRRREAVKKV